MPLYLFNRVKLSVTDSNILGATRICCTGKRCDHWPRSIVNFFARQHKEKPQTSNELTISVNHILNFIFLDFHSCDGKSLLTK